MSDGFLSRWARRKREVRSAERALRPDEAGPEVPQAEGTRDAAAEAPPEAPGETPEALPDLPSLDTLTGDSDLAPFLRAGVPAALRNAALRRMWSLDPAIRDFVSEAREYAYDWNTPGGVPGLGPLLPSDDVQAMLRRIVGGVPGEAPPSASGKAGSPEPARPDPGSGDAGDDEVAGSGEAPPHAAEEETESASMPLLAEPGAVLAVAPAIVPAQSARPSETVSEAVERPSTPEPAPRPRLRRHGGAMPG